MPNTIQKRFDTRQLTQNEENQESYRDQIKQEAKSSSYVAAHQENKWEKFKDIIKCAAETHTGYKKKVNNYQISDPDLERMSKEQKDKRLQIQNCKDPEKNKQLRKSRNEILKKMNQKVRYAREKRAEDLVKNGKDDTQMLKAAEALFMKHQKIQFVHDDQERCVSQPQEVQKIIEQYLMKHFNKTSTTSRGTSLKQRDLKGK